MAADVNDARCMCTRDARGVVTLTLNDPARFNALGSEMLAALQQALDDVARDDSCARGGAGRRMARPFVRGTTSRKWRPTPSWLSTSSCLPSAAA